MQQPQVRTSYEEYLRLEAVTERRYEFFDGVLVAMAEPSRHHEIIVSNLSLLLGRGVRAKGCEFVTRGAVWSEQHNTEIKPDWLVVCDQRDLDGSGPELTRSRYRFPSMVVEVLSPDNRATEMLEKLHAYSGLESLQLYLIIDSTRQKIWRYVAGREGLVEVAAGERVETPYGAILWDAIYERTGVPALRDLPAPSDA
ncbi:MAG: Uma2 family endonuclease [Vulcanimicrobiaceae bacterium]